MNLKQKIVGYGVGSALGALASGCGGPGSITDGSLPLSISGELVTTNNTPTGAITPDSGFVNLDGFGGESVFAALKNVTLEVAGAHATTDSNFIVQAGQSAFEPFKPGDPLVINCQLLSRVPYQINPAEVEDGSIIGNVITAGACYSSINGRTHAP